MKNRLYIIGIGFKPLDERARSVLLNASHILVNDRLLEVFKRYDEYEMVSERVKMINNVDETIEFIKTNLLQPSALNLPIVLLAEGDPMFFGIGRRVVDEFGKDNVEIYPDLSSMQVAFSRIREPWSDAFFISLHGGPDPNRRRKLEYEIDDIPILLQSHHKIGILTDKENNPTRIAMVIKRSPTACSLSPVMFVCERLGYPDERIIEGKPEDIAEMSFLTPNVLIILRQ